MVESQIQEIRRALRSMMSGPVSSSMREKGLAYKLNFGVDAVRLRQLADQLPHTHELSAALWKEDVRELRLLAAMEQPEE